MGTDKERQPMLKAIARGLLPLMLAAALAACVANDMGMEFEEIAEADSSIVFYGPGLDGGYRKFLTAQTAQFDTITVGIYGPRRGAFPRAQIQLHELAPRRYFPSALSLSDYVEETEFFQGRKIAPGAEGETRNAAGSIRYLTLRADAMPCVAFVEIIGGRGTGGMGSKRLSGFYCRETGAAITAGEAVGIVQAIGHRKYGAPKPPPGWGR